jgi:hypothetical protein
VLAATLCLATSLAAEPGDARSFVLRVETPPVESVAHEDGYAEVRIRGFRTHEAGLGAPDVPTRTVLVAIPPGVTPRLSVRLTGSRGFHRLLPRPVPRLSLAPVRDETERGRQGEDGRGIDGRSVRPLYEPAPEHYRGEGTIPRRGAWLGKTGVLRDQRYVEVHLAPVRFDRALEALVVDATLEVTVHFDGEFETTEAPAGADRFEAVYRRAFENYAQGRRFRLSTLDDGLGPAPEKTPAAPQSTGPSRRIRVRENGPLRLDHALVAAHAPELLGSDPGNWRVSSRGEQVALQVHQELGDDGLLEPGEWVQFYAQALDDEPATVITHEVPDSPFENLYEVSDFSDENVYFLTSEMAAQPAMAEREAAPPAGTPEGDFAAVARVEGDDIFFPVPEELWFWLPFTNENSGTRTEIVPLPGLASGTAPASVRVRLRGFIDCAPIEPDHETRVGLENDLAQTLELPGDNPDNIGNQNVAEHDGNDVFVHDIGWTHSGGDPELTDPVHVLVEAGTVDGNCPTGGSLLNENILDSIEVEYRRSFVAEGDHLTFDYPDGDALFEITGFTSDAVDVYEITGRIGTSGLVDAVRLTGVDVAWDVVDETYTVGFRMDDDTGLADGTPRRFVVAGRGGIPSPSASDFEADRASTLVTDPTQADLVVIAHPDLLDSECSEGGNPCAYDVDCTASETDRCDVVPGSALELLLSKRITQGITSRVARIQDVEDEFGGGLAGPEAIRSFLAWVLSGGWNGPPPAYVMLIGDGAFDYKAGTR